MNNFHNLLVEIESLLKKHGKDVDSIDWIECSDLSDIKNITRFEITLDNFIKVASNTEYDHEMYYPQQIPSSLKIYGRDRSFLIYVYEYDGSQRMEYIDMEKTRPTETKFLISLKIKDGKDRPIYEK